MKLLKISEVEIKPEYELYKQSTFWSLFAVVFFVLSMLGIIIWGISGGIPIGMMIFSASGLVIFILIFFSSYKKSLKPENWAVYLTDKHIFIKFRSFLNTAYPEDDPQVVCFKYSEIGSFFKGKETRTTPTMSGTKQIEYIKFIDLYIRTNTLELDKQLNYERTIKAKTRWHHNYVFVKDNKVRIIWFDTNTILTPNLTTVVKSLTKKGVYRTYNSDIANIACNLMSDEDRNILELYNQGKYLESISMARRLYGINLSEAKEFVNELVHQKNNKLTTNN